MTTDPSDASLADDQQVPAEDPAEGSTSPMQFQARDKAQAEGEDDESAEPG